MYAAYRAAMEATASIIRKPAPRKLAARLPLPVWAPPPRYRFMGMYIVPHQHPPAIALIQERVAAAFDIPLAEMTSHRRSRSVARPRQVAMYLAKCLTPRSLPDIGRRFGGRDHTTVIHAIRQIEKLRAADEAFDARIGTLAERLML